MDSLLLYDKREVALDRGGVETAFKTIMHSLNGRFIQTAESAIAIECVILGGNVSARLLSTLRGVSLNGPIDAVCAMALKLRSELNTSLMLVDPSSGNLVDLEQDIGVLEMVQLILAESD
jgi:hypothetical protein